MGKQRELENPIRSEVLEVITKALEEHFDCEVLKTNTGEVAIPVLDADRNEKFAVIKVSIPRGSRNGNGYTPYDGYKVAEDYAEDENEKELKKQAKAEKEAREKALREERKKVRKAIKNLENAVKKAD